MRLIEFPVRSLSLRLLAFALVWTAAVLIAGSLGLSYLFRNTLVRSVDDRLSADADFLISSLQLTADGRIRGTSGPSDSRYQNSFSGWYWVIVPLDGKDGALTAKRGAAGETNESLTRSLSLLDFELQLPDGLKRGAERRGITTGPFIPQKQRRQELRYLVRVRTLYPLSPADDAGADEEVTGPSPELGPSPTPPPAAQPPETAPLKPDASTQEGAQSRTAGLAANARALLTLANEALAPTQAQPQAKSSGADFAVLVAAATDEIEDDLMEFNTLLWGATAALGAGLALAVFFQVWAGLAPLNRLKEKLSLIREGRADKLEGTFPSEVNPLVSELNALLVHNAEVVARARMHVANLAHFLKTPLTVLSNEAAQSRGPLAETVTRQTQSMRRQVDHYLARARAVGSRQVIGTRTEIGPLAADLARALERIYTERGIEIELDIPPGLAFRGERQDLEEMIGNLVDNACKWAQTGVWVTAKPFPPGFVVIAISDDGRGLNEEERQRVMSKGERLDESKPGSGLGLSIVREIAGLYGGTLKLGKAVQGGLLVELHLPASGLPQAG